MDWAKAKNIILVLLLILNVFLLINILGVKETFENFSGYQDNAKQALERAGLKITCSIPSSNKSVPRISFVENDKNVYAGMIRKLVGPTEQYTDKSHSNYYHRDGKTLQFYNDKFVFIDTTGQLSVPFENRKRLDKTLRSWIRKNQISKERFVLDNIFEKENTVFVEYVQLYEKRPVFNNKIIFAIEDKKLKKVEGSLRIFFELTANKEDDIVSAEIVLLTGKDKIKGTVDSMDLGYFLMQQDDLHDTPVWRIKLNSGEVVLFNAFTGEWVDLG